MLGDSLKRRRGGPSSPEEPGPGRDRRLPKLLGPFSAERWAVLAVVIGIASFGVGYLLSTLVLFPRPETAGAGVPVPELYDRTLSDAEATLRVLGLELGDVRELTSASTDSGRVLAQDPVPGQQLLPGASVAVGVSAGAPELRVPPLAGLGQATARDLLETLGFDVTVQQVRSGAFPAGVVTRSEPETGTRQLLPAEVVLLVSTGGPQDTLPAPEIDPVGSGGGR
ncbi:MAG: PASTA domain-containing protein [Candidatus Longimicrobiales bacterium M2_2A_002]